MEGVEATSCFRVRKWVGPGRSIGGGTRLESRLTSHTTNGHPRTRPDQGGKGFAVCDYKHAAIAGAFLGLVEVEHKLRIVREKSKPVGGALEFVSKHE